LSPETFVLIDDKHLAAAADVVFTGQNASRFSTLSFNGHFPGFLALQSQLDLFLFRQLKSTPVTNQFFHRLAYPILPTEE
jgi:hypothetical protein